MTLGEDGVDIKLHNQATIEVVIKLFKMEDCKVTRTPQPAGLSTANNNGEVLDDATPYSQLIGALMHFSSTVRPHLCYSVNHLATFMHKTTEELWNVGKHILR